MALVMSLSERGREGRAARAVLQRDRILDRVSALPIDARVLEAYRQGYDAGYHTALKRAKRVNSAADGR